jgi:deoxyribonuclease-4
MSVSGGFHNAITASVALQCETVQIFTKNPNSWAEPKVADEQVAHFKKAAAEARIQYPTAHDSYLINLAAHQDDLFNKSIASFVAEMERAEALGLTYLVTHPGAHLGRGEEGGLNRLIAGMDEVRSRCPGFNVTVLIETTAGQGTTLGHRFEHIGTILHGVKDASWLGVCFDTCHVFVAGYPLISTDEYRETFDKFDEQIGLRHLKLFHINDSVKGLGSNVDRHASLGQGTIGLEVFRRLVTDPRFADVPMILETPKEDDKGKEMDPVNLGLLRGFRDEITS